VLVRDGLKGMIEQAGGRVSFRRPLSLKG